MDIKKILFGNGARNEGETLDHVGATWDERDCMKHFKKDNFNKGTHRVKVIINNNKELDDFIDEVIQAGDSPIRYKMKSERKRA